MLYPNTQDPIPANTASQDDRLRAALDIACRLLSGWRPSPADLADAPRIDGWCVGQIAGTVPVLLGTVTGHPTPGVGAGPVTMTSPLIWLDADNAWARTVSRFYRLGERSQVFQSDFDSEASATLFVAYARRSLGCGRTH